MVEGITAYLGDEYSYSYAACRALASGTYRAYGTMSKVLAAAAERECEYAVLPIENNIEGAVNEVCDALFDSGLFIGAQYVLPVRHSLIAERGTRFGDITRIVSHAQAIGQCRVFLSGLDGVTVSAVSSTSEALLAAHGTTAAIAYKPRAGQEVLRVGIQDSELNATRFALLCREPNASGSCASIIFDLENKPGALLAALDAAYRRGVNLTRILSRPHRSGDGGYRFFVDFDCADALDVEGMLADVEKHTAAFRFLGQYDVERASNNNSTDLIG